jgi:hypothetical protein
MSMRNLILTAAFLICWSELAGQSGYNSYDAMVQNINKLKTQYSSLGTSRSLIKTAGGKEIWAITIGSGDRDNKPGIVLVGGTEGSHILGKNLAMGIAESLLKDSSQPEIKELLEKITFYILPDVSPDATEFYFSDLKYERNYNSRSTDDDRDFLFDEDPYEDMNKDGLITLIRIADPSGQFVESPDDKRIMVKADPSKGQNGGYLVYSEGFDNDKDKKFNEDNAGGVSFNRNFTFNYEEFGLRSGLHPVSEAETKAVADFLYERFNVYAVFSFGPQDNLGQPMKYTETKGKIITSVRKSDETINKLISARYHDITGAKGCPVAEPSAGSFSDWAYFHYGRYSFSTPGWWFPVEKDQNIEVAFLKYAEKAGLTDAFVPWKEIQNPDFPGKKTEAGGIKPFMLTNAPVDTLKDLIVNHYKFITTVASMHPELEFLNIETVNVDENVFRITLMLHNKGLFATIPEVALNNQWTRIIQLALEKGSGQEIISGQKVQRIERLEGGESKTFSWLVSGKGTLKITAGALNTGTIVTTVNLK